VAVPTLIWGVQDDWTWIDPDAPRDIDVLFIGSTNPAIHARRNGWLLRLGALATEHRVVIRSRLFGPEYARHLARAKLVFNHSVRGEANIRSFEGAVAGACVLNERGNVELPRVATEGEHYASYDEHDLADVVGELLTDHARRLTIARAGQDNARTHTVVAHLVQRLRDVHACLADAPRREPHDRAAWDAFVSTQWRLSSSPRAQERAGGAVTSWTAWRTQLEHDLVRARDAGEAARVADRCAVARSSYERAARRMREEDPAGALALLEDARTPDARFLRASLLLQLGRASEAVDELHAVVQLTPLDSASHIALARARVAAGERAAALRGLDAFIAALQPMPDLADHRSLAVAARAELDDTRVAWAIAEPDELERIAAILRWRVDNPGEADLLRIACRDCDGGPALAEAVQAAFLSLGVDDDALPDTVVYGAITDVELGRAIAGSASERWLPARV
jgi:hypothetical protein